MNLEPKDLIYFNSIIGTLIEIYLQRNERGGQIQAKTQLAPASYVSVLFLAYVKINIYHVHYF